MVHQPTDKLMRCKILYRVPTWPIVFYAHCFILSSFPFYQPFAVEFMLQDEHYGPKCFIIFPNMIFINVLGTLHNILTFIWSFSQWTKAVKMSNAISNWVLVVTFSDCIEITPGKSFHLRCVKKICGYGSVPTQLYQSIICCLKHLMGFLHGSILVWCFLLTFQSCNSDFLCCSCIESEKCLL